MISALWANSNWDDDKGTRKNAIESLNESYGEAILAVNDAMQQHDRPEEEKLADDNPFFAATERGLSKVEQRVKASEMQAQRPKEPEEEIDYMKGLDQE